MAMGESTLEAKLGKRIQEFRKRAGLTQQQLCQKAGLSYSTLAKIERGAIKSPSVFTMQAIAQSVQTTVDELVGTVNSIAKREFKKTKNGVSFVFFDVNGCLVRYYQRAFTLVSKETGISPDVVETAFWFLSDDLNRGKMTIEEFNKAFSSRLGIGSIDWNRYYLEAIEATPGMEEAILYAKKHYKIGLLTNVFPGSLEKLIELGKVPSIDYDVVVDSSVVGLTKPDLKIYELAQKKAGTDSGEILLIDDTMSNLVAAQRAGWHALLFDYSRPEESIANIYKALEPAD